MVSGVFVNARVFADISKYNDWVDEAFRSITNPKRSANDSEALAVEEDKVVEAFPDLDDVSRYF